MYKRTWTGSQEIAEAKRLVAEIMADDLRADLERIVDAGGAYWGLDPEVPGVVAIIVSGTERKALAVVYLADEDFEVDEERVEALK